MKVTILGGFDPETPSAGGVRAYVESLSRYLASTGIDHLSVVAGQTRYERAGWCSVPVRKTGSTAYWLAALLLALRSLPISGESIIHAQRPDELIPFLLSGVGGARVCTLHGNPHEGMLRRDGKAVYAWYAAVEAIALRRTDRIIFVDSVSEANYLERYPWLAGRTEVIPNGVDTDFFVPSDKMAAKRRWGFDGYVFLYAGRLQPEKRVVEIVRAFRRLERSDCLLVIAGDGKERKVVEKESAGLNVRFLGTVARSDMPSLMNASDALVLFSVREGLPSMVLEALACGIPVIVTPVGALPGVVREGETGLFVQDMEGLAEAMQRVYLTGLSSSPLIRESILPYSWVELGPRLVRAYLRAQDVS